ncbi:hypothetical protein PFLUV_G00277230 [Perca fluviatilis]|uniref:Uncharacterized protein n=1 Tax=Perca fluviatilis TaxID=8168 RepID=A0A6A5DME2_PERFL|nr:hypothetical protein PFLUV_G00277230 [Perca fluviatilis]
MCNSASSCVVNRWSGEAECVCAAGYVSVDGLPCQSVCDLQPNFCRNDGKCDIIEGKGAICRRCDSLPTLERAAKFNPVFEGEPVSAQYYRRYDDDELSRYGGGGRALASDEIRHIYEDRTLSKQEMEERLRIVQLCSTDEHFADFVRQTQA